MSSPQRVPFDAVRRAAIVRLLETMNDHLPTDPRGQWQSFGAQPGEKATKRTTCRACSGDGKVNTRTGLQACENCDGRGWYLVDGYTNLRENEQTQAVPLQKMTSAEREAWRLQIDSGIARAQSQMSRPASEQDSIAEANQHPYRWERDRDRMRRRYDYGPLDQALEHLRDRRPDLASLLLAVYTVRTCPSCRARHQERADCQTCNGTGTTSGLIEPSTTLEARVELALQFIDARMPDPIRAPGTKTPWQRRWEVKHAA